LYVGIGEDSLVALKPLWQK